MIHIENNGGGMLHASTAHLKQVATAARHGPRSQHFVPSQRATAAAVAAAVRR